MLLKQGNILFDSPTTFLQSYLHNLYQYTQILMYIHNYVNWYRRYARRRNGAPPTECLSSDGSETIVLSIKGVTHEEIYNDSVEVELLSDSEESIDSGESKDEVCILDRFETNIVTTINATYTSYICRKW